MRTSSISLLHPGVLLKLPDPFFFFNFNYSTSSSHSLRTRLLHSGAATQDIIQIYVHTIRSLREIDPSGVILSLVVSPIRNYLRGRKDTIVVIVSGLIGEGESTLLRQELEGGINSASAGIGALDSNEDAAKSAGIKSGIDDEDEDYDEEDEGPPNWNDENWEPRPTDAGPNFNQSKSEDIINILITIFDDRLGFVKALEQTTAEQLIKIRGYDSSREVSCQQRWTRRYQSRYSPTTPVSTSICSRCSTKTT